MSANIYTLVFVEGDTEVVFYTMAKTKFFPSSRSKIINIGGLFNINRDVIKKASDYARKFTDKQFRVAICVDNESRADSPPVDLQLICRELLPLKNVQQESIRLFVAVQDIECWFLHDIDGVFSFLKVPSGQRNSQKYATVEKFNNRELSRLFKRHNKEYRKGERSTNFISKLDLDCIKERSATFSSYIDFMSEES